MVVGAVMYACDITLLSPTRSTILLMLFFVMYMPCGSQLWPFK